MIKNAAQLAATVRRVAAHYLSQDPDEDDDATADDLNAAAELLERIASVVTDVREAADNILEDEA